MKIETVKTLFATTIAIGAVVLTIGLTIGGIQYSKYSEKRNKEIAEKLATLKQIEKEKQNEQNKIDTINKIKNSIQIPPSEKWIGELHRVYKAEIRQVFTNGILVYITGKWSQLTPRFGYRDGIMARGSDEWVERYIFIIKHPNQNIFTSYDTLAPAKYLYLKNENFKLNGGGTITIKMYEYTDEIKLNRK